jgi:hypothetical protein
MNLRHTLKILHRLGLAVITAVTIATSVPALSQTTPPIIISPEDRPPTGGFRQPLQCQIRLPDGTCRDRTPPPKRPERPDCTKVNCDTKPITPITPSVLFSVPGRIVTAPNYPAMAIFLVEDEYYVVDSVGCPDIGRLWAGIRTEAIGRDEYAKLLQSPKFVGGFACKVPPGFNQGYTSPEIPGGNMLILQHTDGRRYRHYANSSAFFTPLSIAPKAVSSSELAQILKDIPAGKTNFTTKN